MSVGDLGTADAPLSVVLAECLAAVRFYADRGNYEPTPMLEKIDLYNRDGKLIGSRPHRTAIPPAVTADRGARARSVLAKLEQLIAGMETPGE